MIEKKYKGKFGCSDCIYKSKPRWELKRGRYICNWCGKNLNPLKDKIFFSSKISVRIWFFVKEIERHFGIAYKTAWKMIHKIRMFMVDDSNFSNVNIVEID